MNDPIVSFDTLTIGAEIDALGSVGDTTRVPQVLARLPRVEPPRPKTINRIDEAESPVPTAHLAEAVEPLDETEPAPTTEPVGSPFTTIRIDTVTPDRVAQPAPVPQPTAEPEATPPKLRVVDADASAGADGSDEELANWLLNLEATLLPYSRWIALGAVLAALGLTLVLLRSGGGAQSVNQVAPQVSLEASQEALAEAESFAPAWPTDPVSTQSPSVEPTPAQPAPAAIASGPVSLPNATRRAELTGEVNSIPAERIDVADASGVESYPRTNR